MFAKPSWFSAGKALALAASVCGLSAPPVAAVSVNYSLSGALFASFPDDGGAETVSGTWTIDFTHSRVTALSLVATGGETIDFTLDGVGGLQYTGGGGLDQYEMQLQSTVGSPFYLDWQTTAPVTILADSFNGYQSNLHRADFSAYSGLTDPGVLTASAGAAVPEPATWVLMLGGFALIGLTTRRRAFVAA